MAEVKAAAKPHEILLVADSLTGQDAVNLARAFDERVGLTGIVLTRVDGDGRGGAALSMRAVTGKPIKLIGTGEKTDALEDFIPRASRAAFSAWATSCRWLRRPPRSIDDREGRTASPRRCARASSTLTTCASSSSADAEHGRPRRPDGHDARHRQDEEPDRRMPMLDDKHHQASVAP
jgi:hypothetical protein